MALIYFLAELLVIILILRYVFTQQELVFNPFGKMIATITEPLFSNFNLSKTQSNKIIPLLILGIVFIVALFEMLIVKVGLVGGLFRSLLSFAKFFMVFFIISLILGSLVNNSMSSSYVTPFFRIGMPWIKLTRTFIPINSSKIVYPAIALIFILYIATSFLLSIGANSLYPIGNVNYLYIFTIVLKSGLLLLIDILYYAVWLLVARALISWVSPDPRNPIVQLIYLLTEPLLIPFRRVIPTIGILDLSAFVAIIVISITLSILQNFINIIL